MSFELEKQKTFNPEQIFVALGKIMRLERLFLTGYFQRDAIKANLEATNGCQRLNNETLFVTQTISTRSSKTLTFTLLNTRPLRKHAIDITSDSRLFLTEIQLADADNIKNIHYLPNDFPIDFNNSNSHLSSLAIAY